MLYFTNRIFFNKIHPHLLGLCLSERLDDNRLSAAGRTDNHGCVTGHHGLVQLYHFVNLLAQKY